MANQSSSNDYPPGYFKQSTGATVVAVSTALIALDVVFVCLRYYARRLSNTPWGWDDTLVCPALVVNIGTCSLTLRKYSVMGKASLGAHDFISQTVSALLELDNIYRQ